MSRLYSLCLLLALTPTVVAPPVLPTLTPNVTLQPTPCRARPLQLLRQQLSGDFDGDRMSLTAPLPSDMATRRLRHGRTVDAYFSTARDDSNDETTGVNATTVQTADSQRSFLERLVESARPQQSTAQNGSAPSNDSSYTTLLPLTSASLSVRLPWQCAMQTVWKKMAPGVFPPYVQTGRCVQRSCMFGACACTPKKYVIKLLRRVPHQCNPLPMTSADTAYEEVWTVSKVRLTVYCECTRKRRQNSERRQ